MLRPDSATTNGRARAAALVAGIAIAALPAPALAASGGTGAGTGGDAGSGDTSTSSGGGTGPAPTAQGATAELLPNGDAVAPAGAPPQVVSAIEFANRINEKPYEWGGGHSKWKDNGYDCSGAVSYMLHGAGRTILKSPLDSSGLAKWGEAGRGQWITVFANAGHAYAVVAGLRWDTSGGNGPRWHEDMRSGKGYRKRHWPGL